MPPGIVIPELAYPDVRQAVDWLCRCFGFVERLRIADHRAQLSFAWAQDASFGEGSLIVTRRRAETGVLPAGEQVHAVMVRVADLDGHYAHARDCGVRIISPPADYPYGERQYTADDIGGHRWTFSQTIADVDPGTWGGSLIEPS
jgi:uncharacterized glyoxalase superfamily protein PhnB